MLTCVPAVNLAENIGFSAAGTHTRSGTSPLPTPGELRFPLNHPVAMIREGSLDRKAFRSLYHRSLTARLARRFGRWWT